MDFQTGLTLSRAFIAGFLLAFLIGGFSLSAKESRLNKFINLLTRLINGLLQKVFGPNFLLSFRHISLLDIIVTLMIIMPISSLAIEKFQNIEYIDCPSNYAIEVQPGHYVPCTHTAKYWEAEFDGERLRDLELTPKPRSKK